MTFVNISIDNTQLSVYWTHSRVCKLVNTTLHDAELREFWRQYQALKDDCLKDITSDGTMRDDDIPYHWERDYSLERLEFLKSYLNSSLQLLRNMRSLTKAPTSTSSSSPSTSTPRRSGNVTSRYERWKCSLCQGNHQSIRKNIRPYMSCCKVFIDKSVEARKSFIKKSGFCFICLGDVRIVKAHVGGKCPNFDHNVCKSCNEKPPHHPLLCQRSRANNHGSPRRGGGS